MILWEESVAKMFPEAISQDAINSIEPLGGFYLQVRQIDEAEERFPEIIDLLRIMKIIRSKYTHGGYYYFADPTMYFQRPSWIELRSAVEYRLELMLKAMPKSIDVSTLNYSSWLILIGLLDMVRADIATIYWNELCLYYSLLGERSENVQRIHSIDRFMMWAVQVTLDLLPL